MHQSELFTKTVKENPKDETAINAQLLERAGFVQKALAGVYSYLPLGVRVLAHIERIVREEMAALGSQELFLPALHPKELWEQTGRWDSLDALFKIHSRHGFEYALGPTHEEMVVPLVKPYLQSYRDLPFSVFQIQTKFRDEPRAKSGLLRGREFRMKDMYSFHADERSLDSYYELAKGAYARVFTRLGLDAMLTEASGGSFSKYSHEFQVQTATGEDTIFYCGGCDYAVNKEISNNGACVKCGGTGEQMHASEVGNIFKLNTKYSAPFDLSFRNEEGEAHAVLMGCYGIGTSRLMGTIVEVHNDERGIVWPASVAPFGVHVLALPAKGAAPEKEIAEKALALLRELADRGCEALFDDRKVSAGEKFADADLIGIPLRAVISEKSLASGGIEIKRRASEETAVEPLGSAVQAILAALDKARVMP